MTSVRKAPNELSLFRKAKQGFSDLASAVQAAPVVTGVRLPDNETDLVVHRGGRFINNMCVLQ